MYATSMEKEQAVAWNEAPTSLPTELIEYYEETGMDYGAWSKGFNMHFGFWKWGLNPFRREGMLEQMSREILQRVRPAGQPEAKGTPIRLGDFGCGLGATTRTALAEYADIEIDALTVVDWQVDFAKRLTNHQRAHFHTADYCATPFKDERFDGVYMVESICHAEGLHKKNAIHEVMRNLKPGGRFVVADGFLKQGRPKQRWLAWCIEQVAHNWAVDTFADQNAFLEALAEAGFTDIRCEEISWQIAPSVLHTPVVLIRFLLKQLFFGKRKMTRARWGHLRACALAPIVGLARRHFGYMIIIATKPFEGGTTD